MKGRHQTGTGLAFPVGMVKLYLLLLAVSTAFAQENISENLSPYVQNIEVLYPKNKRIFTDCVDKYPSKDKNHGCVEAYKYMRGLCEVTHEYGFERKYKRIFPHYFDRACEMAPLGDNRWGFFVELDEKSCVRGYETTADRLKTFNDNKDLISELGEEKYLYMYEKNSCQSLESYVNFCSYVDGPRKNRLPGCDDLQAFPKVKPGQDPEKLCKPVDSGQGVFAITYDLTAAMQNPKAGASTYAVWLIKQYRARMPAGKNATFFACDQIRTDYLKYGCQRYAGLTEGEPIWRTERFMKDMRLLNADRPADPYEEHPAPTGR